MLWFKKKNSDMKKENVNTSSSDEAFQKINFTLETSVEEKEEVMAHLTKMYPNQELNVQSIFKLDHDKEAAAVIVASVLANDKPESIFRLVSIEESEGKEKNA